MDYKKVLLLLSPLVVFVIYSNYTRISSESVATTSIPLSTLPTGELSPIHKNRIVHNCSDFNLKKSEDQDTEKGCVLVTKRPTDNSQTVYVDYHDFTNRDLKNRLQEFFPEKATAPLIILEGDTFIVEDLRDAAFNFVIR